MLASCAVSVMARAQATGESAESRAAAPGAHEGHDGEQLLPRVFATVRLGPVGRTTVRAWGRELAGEPAPAPGVGARLDFPLNPQLLLGVDAGVLFESEDKLRPYGEEAASVNGLTADLVLALRPLVRIDEDRMELYASIGAGLSGRTALSGDLPLPDAASTTGIDSFPDTAAWGVLAQAGLGGAFWLSARWIAFVEVLVVGRQTNAVIEDRARGDYLLQITDTHALLLLGFGTTIGAR